ncbi:ribosome biogenesis GTP-binding protein YsxC, partial [archaeon]
FMLIMLHYFVSIDGLRTINAFECGKKVPKLAIYAFSRKPPLKPRSLPQQKPSQPPKGAQKAHPGNRSNKPFASRGASDRVESPKPKNFATKTILGQHIITCREFKLDSKKEFEFIGSYTNADQIPIYPIPEVAFVGRSNVGKSSLLNCISGASKNIAVESKIPGRTQCINLFKCKDMSGDICIFTDLPGYGFAKLGKEQQRDISTFVNKYLVGRAALKLTVVIVDARRGQQESDTSMMEVSSMGYLG